MNDTLFWSVVCAAFVVGAGLFFWGIYQVLTSGRK
jgi:hypothetical protein